MIWENPVYRDKQQAPVSTYCSQCGGEIYVNEPIMPGCLCVDCWERKYSDDKERESAI
jgi:hypothetical protein